MRFLRWLSEETGLLPARAVRFFGERTCSRGAAGAYRPYTVVDVSRGLVRAVPPVGRGRSGLGIACNAAQI